MVVWGLARCGMFGFGLEVGRGWWWRDGLFISSCLVALLNVEERQGLQGVEGRRIARQP